MSFLRGLWKAVTHKHVLMLEASLMTAFLFNPRVPDSLTALMSHTTDETIPLTQGGGTNQLQITMFSHTEGKI